jgi:hypothetical protein
MKSMLTGISDFLRHILKKALSLISTTISSRLFKNTGKSKIKNTFKKLRNLKNKKKGKKFTLHYQLCFI